MFTVVSSPAAAEGSEPPVFTTTHRHVEPQGSVVALLPRLSVLVLGWTGFGSGTL